MTVLTRPVRRLHPVDTEGSTARSPGPVRSENRAAFHAVPTPCPSKRPTHPSERLRRRQFL